MSLSSIVDPNNCPKKTLIVFPLSARANPSGSTLKPILIEQDEGASNSIMSIAGTALGAIAGAQLGGGTGRIAGAIGGGLAGGYATNAVMGKIQTQKGVEFTVKLDNGQMLTFGQAGDINKYYTGQRVKLVTSNDGITKIDSQ